MICQRLSAMKQPRFQTAAFLLLLVFAPLAAADSLEAALRQAVEDSLSAYNSEDSSAALASVHSNSPVYASMQEALPAQFSAISARTSLENFTFIGRDEEFAIARVQYRTVGEEEPFMDNIIDTIAIFHQENGAWKYWDQHILGARIVP
jgi:hypothetical protein